MMSNRRDAVVAIEQLISDFKNCIKPLLPFDDGWYSGWMRNRTECPYNDNERRQQWLDGKFVGVQDRDKHDAEGIESYGTITTACALVETAGSG